MDVGLPPGCGVDIGIGDGSGTMSDIGVGLCKSVAYILDTGTSGTLESTCVLGIRTVGGGFVAVSTLGSILVCFSSDVEIC